MNSALRPTRDIVEEINGLHTKEAVGISDALMSSEDGTKKITVDIKQSPAKTTPGYRVETALAYFKEKVR